MQPWFDRQRDAMRTFFEQALDEGCRERHHQHHREQHHRGPGGGPGGPGGPGGRQWGGWGPFGGPPGWGGFGGPFGGGPGGRHRGWGPFGRGPKIRRGDVRAAALALIAEQPRNGYQIIQEITERSGHLWRPSSGSVYPALQQLEDEGLIRVVTEEGRRAFHLTESGQQYVNAHQDELRAPWDEVTANFDDSAMNIWKLIGQVSVAVAQVQQVGTPSQIQQAR